MPFVRISLRKGRPAAYVRAVSDSVHRALVAAFDTPAADRFQAIHQHDDGELVFDRDYLGGPRSDGFIVVCVTAGRQRDTAVKRAFYRRLVQELAHAPGIAPEDVMAVIGTTGAEDWSFGGGRMAWEAR